jgi:hypothetical protein
MIPVALCFLLVLGLCLMWKQVRQLAAQALLQTDLAQLHNCYA